MWGGTRVPPKWGNRRREGVPPQDLPLDSGLLCCPRKSPREGTGFLILVFLRGHRKAKPADRGHAQYLTSRKTLPRACFHCLKHH